MSFSRSLAFCTALLAGTGLSSLAMAENLITAIKADKMIDPASGQVIDQPVVLVQDGKILASGKGIAIPAKAKVIDLKGQTLLPGLIDMHVHIDISPKYGGYRGLEFTDNFWAFVAVANAEADLKAGFTTLRNVGSNNYNDIAIDQAANEGFVRAPRIIGAAYALGSTGGHCDETFFPPSFNRVSPGVADSPDAFRKKVREQRKFGAQVIKICATGGVFSRGDSPGAQQMTMEELKAVASEAHMASMKVAAHAHGASGIRDSIIAGIDTIEHASLIDDEGIAAAKAVYAKGGKVWLSMDIYNTDYTQAEGKKNGVLEDNLKKDRDIGDLQRENFKKAYKAGLKMVFGTDAGVYPHGDNAKQFSVMTRYGMSNLDAIRSATSEAADALGMAGQVGTLNKGAFADLIAVKTDPLKDIKALEKVSFVMKGGEVIKDEK